MAGIQQIENGNGATLAHLAQIIDVMTISGWLAKSAYQHLSDLALQYGWEARTNLQLTGEMVGFYDVGEIVKVKIA